jgi:hypothetical protein
MNNINVLFPYLLIHQQEQRLLYVIRIVLIELSPTLFQGPIRSTIKQAKLSSAKRLCEHLLQSGWRIFIDLNIEFHLYLFR